ncbi:MAG: hypothetical protein KF729_12420 [Sandaracinaceae bacterium]|nr:hypothetical protein [Sandaracinaceae bacterium]
MLDIVAFRDVDGVGWFGLDQSGRYWLSVPSSDAPLHVSAVPRDARQAGLGAVHVGPDGWWLFTWASWTHDHSSSRLPAERLFFVSLATMRAERVDWPWSDFLFTWRAVVPCPAAWTRSWRGGTRRPRNALAAFTSGGGPNAPEVRFGRWTRRPP